LLGEEQEKIFNIDLTKFELFDNLIKIFEQEQISFDVIILNA
jgi:short-subunit dehydrogenase